MLCKTVQILCHRCAQICEIISAFLFTAFTFIQLVQHNQGRSQNFRNTEVISPNSQRASPPPLISFTFVHFILDSLRIMFILDDSTAHDLYPVELNQISLPVQEVQHPFLSMFPNLLARNSLKQRNVYPSSQIHVSISCHYFNQKVIFFFVSFEIFLED